MSNLSFLFDTIFTLKDKNQQISSCVDFAIVAVLVGIIFGFLCVFARKKKLLIPCGVFSLIILTATILRLEYAAIFLIILYLLYLLLLVSRNLIDAKIFFGKKTKKYKNNKPKSSNEIEKLYDHDSLYATIDETVAYLSKNKIGALMTFERKDRLKEVLKNGTYLNAPVTYELLITIFYPGTRLHDGAVVIKGNTIVSASVYYKPTTTPLTGKYGSRHRAALGISEISDSVTVVVSEETGRISIAYNGELTGYSIDNFSAAFENIMNETDISIG